MSELSHKDWIGKASAIRFRDKAFIDGKTVAARSGRTFASINPATGETLAQVLGREASLDAVTAVEGQAEPRVLHQPPNIPLPGRSGTLAA